MDLCTGAVPGDGAVPMAGDDSVWKRLWEEVAGGCAKAALATARRTGVTEAGFCIATEDRPRKKEQYGASGEVGVAVTEQRDEDQEGGGRGDRRRKDFRTLETTD